MTTALRTPARDIAYSSGNQSPPQVKRRTRAGILRPGLAHCRARRTAPTDALNDRPDALVYYGFVASGAACHAKSQSLPTFRFWLRNEPL
jgi:hypothetical protein